jgi:hypothetical protein
MAKHKKDPKSNFIQNGRNGTHLRNPSNGYKMPGLSEVHHILCHSCVQDAAIFVKGTDKPYILKCLAITKWDVNNSQNLIGLPKKWAYVLDYAGHAAWDKLPCHQRLGEAQGQGKGLRCGSEGHSEHAGRRVEVLEEFSHRSRGDDGRDEALLGRAPRGQRESVVHPVLDGTPRQ